PIARVNAMSAPCARSGLRLVVLAIATAVPVAISRTWGWPAAVVIAAAGSAWIARGINDRYVRPVERMAGMLRQKAPRNSTDDLAQLLVAEYRDAVNRTDETLCQTPRPA